MEPTHIDIRGARVHNLRNVSLKLPRNALICFTGVSGSGKSSLAFDTLYAEGQRRYVESLSSYARQFLGQIEKPDCDLITGLSPSIAIQQKTAGQNPRSTVGTITAIHDFLRVLYARVGVQHCTRCGRPITAQTREQIVGGILAGFEGQRVSVLAPVARGQKGEFRDLFADLLRSGFVRARVDGRWVELRSDASLEKNKRHDIEVVVDRIAVRASDRTRLAEAVETGLRVGQETLVIVPAEPRDGDDAERTATRSAKGAVTERIFSSRYACTDCDLSYEPPTPQTFSFNSPMGMCLRCDGLGEMFDFDSDLLVPDDSKNFFAPCVAAMRTKPGRWRRHIYKGVAKHLGIDLERPWRDLPKDARHAMLFGTGDAHITFEWRWSRGVWKHGDTFEGVVAELREKYRKAGAAFVRGYYEKFMRRGTCSECGGARLNAQARAVRLPFAASDSGTPERQRRAVGGGNSSQAGLHELCALPVAEVLGHIGRLALTPVQQEIAGEVLKEVRTRLQFLMDVGLHYLSLDRSAPTLSGGEAQRIRLAGQIGSGLAGVLYVLDEPSIGLHPRDNRRLLHALKSLRDMGNTVLVVEHDEETMREADYLVDFGPGPGVRGGDVVAEGSLDHVTRQERSLTGAYLRGEREIAIPPARRPVMAPPGTKARRSR